MPTAHLLGKSLAVLVLLVIGVTLAVRRVKRVHWRKALEQPRERYMSGLALIRYVQLNRQCSEVLAYERLATFVKHHRASAEAGSIERMATHDRQSLLQLAQSLLVHDSNAIDKI